MKNPMTNTTELDTNDTHTHDNIVKTVDLREDTTNTLEPSASHDNLVSVVTNNVNVPQLMVNGQAITLGDTPIEIPLLQQTAKVNIETIVAEKVQLMTQNVSHETQIPVTLRHEELVTEKVEYDEPTVLATTHIAPEEVNLVSK